MREEIKALVLSLDHRPYSEIAKELNLRGFKTARNNEWTHGALHGFIRQQIGSGWRSLNRYSDNYQRILTLLIKQMIYEDPSWGVYARAAKQLNDMGLTTALKLKWTGPHVFSFSSRYSLIKVEQSNQTK